MISLTKSNRKRRKCSNSLTKQQLNQETQVELEQELVVKSASNNEDHNQEISITGKEKLKINLTTILNAVKEVINQNLYYTEKTSNLNIYSPY